MFSYVPFETEDCSSTKEIAHDWLWDLSESKYQAYVREPEMFKVYTSTYRNPVVWTRHIEDLVRSLKEASGIEDEEQLHAILLAFPWLSSPVYAERWFLIDIKRELEGVWKLIESGLE
ncbi:hypothetical protein [Oceanobacillus kimchii]|uniref:hypothetical protein n=1 Tax=Oceanobacillus kimchii TaxID=746691 RepID=UPI00233013FC|nr:hypothetical protein [Oceanobacillus kimchii]